MEPDLSAFPILRIDQIPFLTKELLRDAEVDLLVLIQSLNHDKSESPEDPMLRYVLKQLQEIREELIRRAASERIQILLSRNAEAVHGTNTMFTKVPHDIVADDCLTKSACITVSYTNKSSISPPRARFESEQSLSKLHENGRAKENFESGKSSKFPDAANPIYSEHAVTLSTSRSKENQVIGSIERTALPIRPNSGNPSRRSLVAMNENFGNTFIVSATERKKRFFPKKVDLESPEEVKNKERLNRRKIALERLMKRREQRAMVEEKRRRIRAERQKREMVLSSAEGPANSSAISTEERAGHSSSRTSHMSDGSESISGGDDDDDDNDNEEAPLVDIQPLLSTIAMFDNSMADAEVGDAIAVDPHQKVSSPRPVTSPSPVPEPGRPSPGSGGTESISRQRSQHAEHASNNSLQSDDASTLKTYGLESEPESRAVRAEAGDIFPGVSLGEDAPAAGRTPKSTVRDDERELDGIFRSQETRSATSGWDRGGEGGGGVPSGRQDVFSPDSIFDGGQVGGYDSSGKTGVISSTLVRGDGEDEGSARRVTADTVTDRSGGGLRGGAVHGEVDAVEAEVEQRISGIPCDPRDESDDEADESEGEEEDEGVYPGEGRPLSLASASPMTTSSRAVIVGTTSVDGQPVDRGHDVKRATALPNGNTVVMGRPPRARGGGRGRNRKGTVSGKGYLGTPLVVPGNTFDYAGYYGSFSMIFPVVYSSSGPRPLDAINPQLLLQSIQHQLRSYDSWLEIMADYMTVFSVDEGEFGGAGYSAGRHGLLLDGPQMAATAGTSADIGKPQGLFYRIKSSRPEVSCIVKDVFQSSLPTWADLPAGLGLGMSWNLLWSWGRPKLDPSQLLVWQRVNYFKDSQHLTRKDWLKRSLQRLTSSGGKTARYFDIMPLTFLLPQEYTSFVRAFYEVEANRGGALPSSEIQSLLSAAARPGEEPGLLQNSALDPVAALAAALSQKGGGGERRENPSASVSNLWILKPVGLSRGRGISLVQDVGAVVYSQASVIQKYIERPLCLGGYKFDLRLFVLVTSFRPLEAFIYEEGFARLSSLPYSLSGDSLENKFVHLTNSSIQKQNREGMSADNPAMSAAGPGDEGKYEAGGSKIPLLGENGLWQRLKNHGVQREAVWSKICGLVVKSLVAVDEHLSYQPCSFEVFGYDVLLDADLRPWLIEVNASPSLARETPLDVRVKNAMIRDTILLLDPAPFNRAAIVEVLKRRLKEISKNKVILSRSDPDLNPDMCRILEGFIPRKYGELPKYLGEYRMICPNTSAYEQTMRKKNKLIKSLP